MQIAMLLIGLVGVLSGIITHSDTLQIIGHIWLVGSILEGNK